MRLSEYQFSNMWWIYVGLAFGSLIMALVCFDAKLSPNGDNAEYIILGQSILEGQGLSYIHEPVIKPGTKYPFGLPILLAGVQYIFPNNIIALKGFIATLFVLTIPLIFYFFSQFTHSFFALALALLCMVSPPLLEYSHQVMSEIPYLMVSLLAILCLKRVVDHGEKRAVFIALLMVVLAYYMRTVGITLVVAGIVYWLLNKKYKEAGWLCFGSLILLLPWYLRNAFVGGGRDYYKQALSVNPYQPSDGLLGFMSLIERIIDNLYIYGIRVIPQIILPGMHDLPVLEYLVFIPGFLFFTFLIWGVWNRGVLAIYLVFYFGMFLVWPQVWAGVRYLVPVIPFLLFAILWCITQLIPLVQRYTSHSVISFVLPLFFILLYSSNIQGSRELMDRTRQEQAEWQSFFEAGAWLRLHTAPNAVIFCPKEFMASRADSCHKSLLMYVLAGRKTLNYRSLGNTQNDLTVPLSQDVELIYIAGQSQIDLYHNTLSFRGFNGAFKLLQIVPYPNTYILKYMGMQTRLAPL